MTRRPTKDLDLAVFRLTRAKEHLICVKALNYGGSIEADLLRVLQALDTLRAADAVVPVPSDSRDGSTRATDQEN